MERKTREKRKRKKKSEGKEKGMKDKGKEEEKMKKKNITLFSHKVIKNSRDERNPMSLFTLINIYF